MLETLYQCITSFFCRKLIQLHFKNFSLFTQGNQASCEKFCLKSGFFFFFPEALNTKGWWRNMAKAFVFSLSSLFQNSAFLTCSQNRWNGYQLRPWGFQLCILPPVREYSIVLEVVLLFLWWHSTSWKQANFHISLRFYSASQVSKSVFFFFFFPLCVFFNTWSKSAAETIKDSDTVAVKQWRAASVHAGNLKAEVRNLDILFILLH